MSTPGSNNNPMKRRLVKDSPFSKLTARTESTGNEALREARQVHIDKIQPNPRQPRRRFDPERLAELAQDIEARGILQPLIVRPVAGTDQFQIVVGERRYQAARSIGMDTLPVLIRELDDREAEVTSLVENIQREDLSLADEANYFKLLKDKYDLSMREIAETVAHKSHTYVETRLNLALHPDILEEVENQQIGIQEAVQRMRTRQNLRRQLDQTKNLLNKSQSVIGNDNSLEKSQFNGREKPEYRLPRGLQSSLSKLVKDARFVNRHLPDVEDASKAIVIEQIRLLEEELVFIKQQLGIF